MAYMQKTVNIPKVLIIGGGFAGIRSALDLSKKLGKNIDITLISKNTYFEYYPALYRVATGGAVERTAIPLGDIFDSTGVQVVQDEIIHVNTTEKKVTGKSGTVYAGDYLLLALGSQNNFFNIEGVNEISYNFQSTQEALRLKQRIHKLFEHHTHGSIEETLLALHFIVAGAGPSGVELTGELAQYVHELAKKFNINETLITIDLIERGPHVLSKFPESVSLRAEARLRKLGVNLLLNRSLIKNESWTVFLQDMTLGAKTVIWTAGTQPHASSQNISGFFYTEKGKVIVDAYLRAKGCDQIFVAGDIADTPYSGLAQTALYHGRAVANIISADIQGLPLPLYLPKPNGFDVPIGKGWAIFMYGSLRVYGRFGWWIRYLIDLKFYMSIVPFHKAWKIFTSKKVFNIQDTQNKIA